MRASPWFLGAAIVLGGAGATLAGEGNGLSVSTPASETLVPAILYDFFLSEGTKVSDASGNKHDGELINGELISGRRRNAIKLDGQGMIAVTGEAGTIHPASRALMVGAVCNPTAPDGVLVSMGDESNGFSLYIKDRRPHFAIRTGGKRIEAADTEPIPLNEWTHLIGGIDANGEVWLIINGWLAAHTPGRHLRSQPAEPFCVGADPGSPVGDYKTPMNWQGMLQEVRLYWGFIDLKADKELMKDWADLTGCGCK